LLSYIKKERCEWIGYLERMDHGRVVLKIFEITMERRRKMGKSRLTWLKVQVKVER
jgi:hypothetical protein